MGRFVMTDSPEWEKIVDKAYENAKQCGLCGKESLITLPAHIEVHGDDFTTLNTASTFCCDTECEMHPIEYVPNLDCVCIRCDPSSESSEDWCFVLAGHIDENGEPI